MISREEGDRHLGEPKRRARLAQTAAELNVVFADGAILAAGGDEAFETDMLVQRAARSVINDLHETIDRLPDRYAELIPEQMRDDLRSMRIILTYLYQQIDWAIVRDTIRIDLPRFREHLRSVPGIEDRDVSPGE